MDPTLSKWKQDYNSPGSRFVKHVTNVTTDGELFVKKKNNIYRKVASEKKVQKVGNTYKIYITDVYEEVAKQLNLFE